MANKMAFIDVAAMKDFKLEGLAELLEQESVLNKKVTEYKEKEKTMWYNLSLYRKGLKNKQPVYYSFDLDISYDTKEVLEVVLGNGHFKAWNDTCCCVFYNKLKRAYEILGTRKEFLEKLETDGTFGTVARVKCALGELLYKIEELDKIDGMENVYLEVDRLTYPQCIEM